jgi:ribonuclease HII
VILPEDRNILEKLSTIRDSKQLTAEERETARVKIEKSSLAWAVGFATNQEIDRLGIVPATRLAIWRALEELNPMPDHILVDYLVLPDLPIPQTRLVKGDARSLSIAAASILAKTHRDAFMVNQAAIYPDFAFEKNKGYGTAHHRKAIQTLGPCPIHRMTFAPLREIEKKRFGS